MAKAKDQRRNANAFDDTARNTESRQESGLARWSRRKATTRAETASPSAAMAKAKEASAIEKTDADMPAIDSLDSDSDYSVFLSPKVSEKLRRTALRKLFHLPQFNVQDELDFCNGDFRNFTPMGNIITADMRHHMERGLKELNERLKTVADDKRVTEKTSDAAARQTPVSESNPAAALPKESKESDDEPTPKIQTSTMDKTKKG